MADVFTQSQLQAIADALGDTSDGLTGGEIAHLLATCAIKDTDPEHTKRHRLYNAFAHDQNQFRRLSRVSTRTWLFGSRVLPCLCTIAVIAPARPKLIYKAWAHN
jgi:hypothetical protein